MSEPTTPNALTKLAGQHGTFQTGGGISFTNNGWLRFSAEVAALAQRTEPAAPVAWRYVPSDVWHDAVLTEDPEMAKAAREMGRQVTPLYAHPQASTAAVPEGAEAVACWWVEEIGLGVREKPHPSRNPEPMYRHPPRESGDAEEIQPTTATVPVGELVALRRNDARYRWLREQDWFYSPLCVLRDPKRVLTRGVGLGADCPSRDRLDAAIDTARTAEGGKANG